MWYTYARSILPVTCYQEALTLPPPSHHSGQPDHAVQAHKGVTQFPRVLAQAIKDSLDGLPGGERTQIGFLTFDSTLHFYNLKSSLTQPQMMVSANHLHTPHLWPKQPAEPPSVRKQLL